MTIDDGGPIRPPRERAVRESTLPEPRGEKRAGNRFGRVPEQERGLQGEREPLDEAARLAFFCLRERPLGEPGEPRLAREADLLEEHLRRLRLPAKRTQDVQADHV